MSLSASTAMDSSSSSSSSSGEEALAEALEKIRAAGKPPPAVIEPAASEGGGTGERTPLALQVRSCEQRWATDAYKTAIGEIDANKVSLVAIGGFPRNAALLYGDMCALGYGRPNCIPDVEEGEKWWLRAESVGHRMAPSRLKGGVFNSMLHMDPTNDNQETDGWLDTDSDTDGAD